MSTKKPTPVKRPAAKAKPAAPKKVAAPAKKAARREIDWEAVERDYRTGFFTDREIGAKYGCSHTAVQKHARDGGWQKDMAGAVKAATEARLIEHEIAKTASREVAKRVAKQVAKAIPATTEVVASLAELNSSVILRQRGDLRLTRDEAISMLKELTWQRENMESLDRLAVIVAGESPSPAAASERLKVFHRAVGLGSRISNVKALAETLAKLIPLEREAFGIKEGSKPSDGDAREMSDDELMAEIGKYLGRIDSLPG